MATKRLIDATPIIDECKECSAIEWNRNVYTTWAEAEEDFMERLLDAPIVDAVEVDAYNDIVYKLECLLCHATGGSYSKAGYSLKDMERMVTDYIEECCEEAVSENAAHGRWELTAHEEHCNYRWNVTAECSNCHNEKGEIYAGFFTGFPKDLARELVMENAKKVKLDNYCPNCGADMRGRKDNGQA